MSYVIVGGGIAGVSCLKRLLVSLPASDSVVLISASRRVKAVTQWRRIGQYAEQFDVKEDEMISDDPRLTFIQAKVVKWNYKTKELLLSNSTKPLKYDKLCIATGALPIAPFSNARVLTIRDIESAAELERRLKGAKRVAVVGNGGIATEVVFELKGVNITWIIRDDSISSVFFNPAIANFFQQRLETGRQEGVKNAGVLKRLRYATAGPSNENAIGNVAGCALGPDWISSISFEDSVENRTVSIIRNVEVQGITDSKDGVLLSLSNGDNVEADVVIWATGVIPNTRFWKDDCEEMRLWTQARQMGDYCARSMMENGNVDVDICFELFTHTTTFFGYKIVFIGDFKAERQPKGWYAMERVIEDDQFVQCIMFDHRVVGAVLVGETDLEETIENLILNKTNLERIEESFLDPGIDIEDYFD